MSDPDPRIPDELIDALLEHADPNDPTTWPTVEFGLRPESTDPDPKGVATIDTQRALEQVSRDALVAMRTSSRPLDATDSGISATLATDEVTLAANQVAGNIESELPARNSRARDARDLETAEARARGVLAPLIRRRQIADARATSYAVIARAIGWALGAADAASETFYKVNAYYADEPVQFAILVWLVQVTTAS